MYSLLAFLLLVVSPVTVQSKAIPKSLQRRAPVNITTTNKAGLAWGNSPTTDMDQFFSTGKVSWYYSWSSWPTDEGNSIDFVPLLWGGDTKRLNEWRTNINGTLKPMFQNKQITCVLGMNEPQEKGQSNMTPKQAKDLWVKEVEPLRALYNVRLGSPATSSNPNGKVWMQDWFKECGTNCNVDFVALHYYGNNATDFIRYVTDFHNTFQKPLWITEWACQDFTGKDEQCNQQHVIDYLNVTQTFMDSVDWVERYSWFGALMDNPINNRNSLLSKNGTITPLGEQYIGQIQPEIISNGETNPPGFDNTPIYSNSANSRATPSAIPLHQYGMFGMLLGSIPMLVAFYVALIC